MEARQHSEQFAEQQVRASLDFVNHSLDDVHTSLSDVTALHAQLGGDLDHLGQSLRQHLQTLDEESAAHREQLLQVNVAIQSLAGSLGDLTDRIGGVEDQVAELEVLPARLETVEELCENQCNFVTLPTLLAQTTLLSTELQGLSEHLQSHDTQHATASSAVSALDNQYADLADRLEQCNTIVFGQESLLNEYGERLQTEVGTLQDSIFDVFSQLGAVREGTKVQLEGVEEVC